MFISCPQGLEELLIAELSEMGFSQAEAGFRGVFLDDVPFSAVYKVNYCSRIASRVLWPILQFPCYDRDSLYKRSGQVDWTQYIPKGRTIAIDANVTHRALKNSLFAAQVVKDAICDQLRAKRGIRPSIDTANPDIQLNLYIQDNRAFLSFDTSRIPLNKRGYRQQSVEAPMPENFAAALLRLANYTGEEMLCDPCCGSGTILIEAALMATKTPPGYLRHQWGFMAHPLFSSTEWLKVKNEADLARTKLQPGRILGLDVDRRAVTAAIANLRAAGLKEGVEVVQQDFQTYQPKSLPNFILTNPPHGRRLGDEETLAPLYRALGDFMKRKAAKPARGFIFTSSLPLSKEIGLTPKRRHVLSMGGVESRFLEYDLY